MIIVAYKDEHGRLRVSHGIDTDTLSIVGLPDMDFLQFCNANKAVYDTNLQEWVIE